MVVNQVTGRALRRPLRKAQGVGGERPPKLAAKGAPAQPGGRRLFGAPLPTVMPALPTAPKPAVVDPLAYTLLLYGREKIGKTVWLSSFPDALFLTFEPGTTGLPIYEYNAEDGGCRRWEFAQAAVAMLEQTDRFKTVIFDTADAAYDRCLDYICAKMGIDHPGEAADGKKDWGKSWKAIRQELSNLVYRIRQTGRGVAFTSHATEETFKRRDTGEEFVRIHPSMGGQARKVVEAIVDLFFYCEYIRSPEGEVRRVMVTEGDEVVFAGHRSIRDAVGNKIHLPRLIPMTEEGGFEIYKAAFAGQDVGLDPKTLLPGKTASKAVRDFFKAVRRDSAGNGARPPARPPARKAPRRR